MPTIEEVTLSRIGLVRERMVRVAIDGEFGVLAESCLAYRLSLPRPCTQLCGPPEVAKEVDRSYIAARYDPDEGALSKGIFEWEDRFSQLREPEL